MDDQQTGNSAQPTRPILNSRFSFSSRKLLMRPKPSRQESREFSAQAQPPVATQLPQPQLHNKFRMTFTSNNFFQKNKGEDQFKTIDQRTPSQKSLFRNPQTDAQIIRKESIINAYVAQKSIPSFKEQTQAQNTTESTKITKTFNSSTFSSFKTKPAAKDPLMDQRKQQQFEQEDEEEELQFMLLCQTLEKRL